MGREFEDLLLKEEQERKTKNTRRRERYQYAKSLGLSYIMSGKLRNTSKRRILSLPSPYTIEGKISSEPNIQSVPRDAGIFQSDQEVT